MSKQVPFKVLPHAPQQIIVEAADGKQYEVDLRLAMVEVVDNEAQGVIVPNLVLNYQVVTTIRPLGALENSNGVGGGAKTVVGGPKDVN